MKFQELIFGPAQMEIPPIETPPKSWDIGGVHRSLLRQERMKIKSGGLCSSRILYVAYILRYYFIDPTCLLAIMNGILRFQESEIPTNAFV
jgi:hypothetical protein